MDKATASIGFEFMGLSANSDTSIFEQSGTSETGERHEQHGLTIHTCRMLKKVRKFYLLTHFVKQRLIPASSQR